MERFQNNLEKSILSAIAYFDIFDYPLTVTEIWKWLYFPVDNPSVEGSRPSLSEIWKILEDSQLIKSLVDNRRGFYFLKNRGELVATRQARYVLAEEKTKKAKRAAKFIKLMPGVKMIALCNSLAWANAREESDIDFFIVTARNKIWTARFWTAGFLQLFGLRPSEGKTKNKICLSFFVDEDSLDLESLVLGQPDIYLIYWIAELAPLYDRSGLYQKFWRSNAWVKNFLPNVFPREEVITACDGASVGKIGVGERFFRWLQMKLLPKNLKEIANHASQVVITDKILKFHINDRREEYREKWIKRISELAN